MAYGPETLDCTIPGTTQMPHMLENIGADNVKFTDNEMKQFNSELASMKLKEHVCLRAFKCFQT